MRRRKTIGYLIDFHISDLSEVGKPVRNSKRAVLNSFKKDLGAVQISNLDRTQIIKYGKKRAKQSAGPVTLSNHADRV